MQPEHDLQYSIVAYLRANKILCFETDVMSGLQFFNKKDPRRFLFIKHHHKMGYVNGQPDLILALKDGEVIFVELKNGETGRQSPEQKAVEKELKALNNNYLVWRSLDDAKGFVRGYSILRGGK